MSLSWHDCNWPNLQLMIGASCCGLARKATPPRPACQRLTSRGAENPGKKKKQHRDLADQLQHTTQEARLTRPSATDGLFQALRSALACVARKPLVYKKAGSAAWAECTSGWVEGKRPTEESQPWERQITSRQASSLSGQQLCVDY